MSMTACRSFLLVPDECEQWLHDSFDDALAFQSRCFPDDLIEMTRTDELWVKRRPTGAATDAAQSGMPQ